MDRSGGRAPLEADRQHYDRIERDSAAIRFPRRSRLPEIVIDVTDRSPTEVATVILDFVAASGTLSLAGPRSASP
jgi:hypothetical protein